VIVVFSSSFVLLLRKMMSALCLYDGAGGGSDSYDAASFMCCHERRGREVLGMELQWPGETSCVAMLFS